MSEEKWKTVELYGGAFTLEVPERFYDISQYRDVPNHQEVRTNCHALMISKLFLLQRLRMIQVSHAFEIL